MHHEKKDLETIKFNLTENMAKELIEFNEIKKDLYNLKKNINTIDDKVLYQIEKYECELKKCKNKFIREFRRSNKKQILEYLNKKNQS